MKKELPGKRLVNIDQIIGVLDNLQDSYFQADMLGNFTFANPMAVKMYGYGSVNEIIGKPAEILYANKNDRELIIAELRRSGRVTDWICRGLRKDGSDFWVSMNVQFLRDDMGQVIGTEGVIRDISERKQYTEALRESQLLLTAIMNSTSDFVWSVDPDNFGLLSFNKGFRDYFLNGRGISIQIGMRPEDLFPPGDYVEIWKDFYSRAMEEGTFSTEYVTYSGNVVFYLTFSLLKHDDRIFGISVFGKDVTEQKQNVEIIRQNEKKYRELFQVNKDGIAIFLLNQNGPPTTFVEVNDAAHRMLGYTREEMLQITPMMLEPYTPKEQLQNRHLILKSKGILDFETVLLHKQGHPIYAEFTAQVIEFEGKPAVMNIVRDVSEQKQHEKELRVIASLSAALRTAPTLREMLPVIVEQLCVLLDSDTISVELIDPITREAVVEAAYGHWTPMIGFRQPEGSGVNAWIAESKQPYLNNNIKDEKRKGFPDHLFDDIQSAAGIPLIAQEQLIGYLWMGRKKEISESEVRLLVAVSDIAANAIYRSTMFEQSLQAAEQLNQAYDTTLEGWAHALELRDHDTEGHARNVVQLTIDLARRMKISESEIQHIRRGALLHDIGKMGIPDSVLLKPGTLNEREWEIMKRHPEYAYNLILPIEYLRPVLDIPYCHHEKWDGSGYPRGLKGEEIPLVARIFAIVDVWDALLSDRPYRKAWSFEQSIKYLEEQSGKHFDPEVTAVFLAMLKDQNYGNFIESEY